MSQAVFAPTTKTSRVSLGQAVFKTSACDDPDMTPPARRRIAVKVSNKMIKSFNEKEPSQSLRMMLTGCHILEFDASKSVMKCKIKRKREGRYNIPPASTSFDAPNVIGERGANRWLAEPQLIATGTEEVQHCVANACIPRRRDSVCT